MTLCCFSFQMQRTIAGIQTQARNLGATLLIPTKNGNIVTYASAIKVMLSYSRCVPWNAFEGLMFNVERHNAILITFALTYIYFNILQMRHLRRNVWK